MSLASMARRIRGAPFAAQKAVRLLAAAYRTLIGKRAVHYRVVRDGIVFDLDLREDVQLRIWLNSFDTDELKWLLKFLSPGDIAIDVGAHIGYFALHFARSVGPTGSVYAFEPDPRNFERLETNISANLFSDTVSIIRSAASDRIGEATLFRTSNDRTGGNSLHAELGGSEDKICVPLVRLDSFCNENHISRIRALKIDVEGHEPAVLRGCANLLQAHRIDVVLMEYLPSRVQRLASDDDAFDVALTKNGYRLLIPSTLPTVDNVFNLLYVGPHVIAS